MDKVGSKILSDQREQFETLVSNVPGIIYRCESDKDWTMYYISDMVEQLTGHPASDFIGNSIRAYSDIIHKDDVEYVENTVLSSLEKKEPFILEYRIIHKDGGVLWVYEKGRGIFNSKGHLKWLDGVIFDITERKEYERLKDDLEHILQHDLKAPINAMISIPRLLKKTTTLNSEQLEGINMIERAGKQMLDMISRSLNLQKLERGIYLYEPEEVDLIELINKAIADLQYLSQENTINFEVHLNASTLTNQTLHIKCDEVLSYSLFSNLIKNAIEASPTNGKIIIKISTHITSVEIKIKNAGTVPKVIRGTFFDKYTTIGKGRNGTGLGTYSAKLMTEIQNGEISMTTSETSGTTITVKMPL